MEDGALGVASSLMYPPGLFAKTDELIALSEVAAEYDGMYISHMRDEGAHMIEAIEELLTIAREANIRAEIYHLKSSGKSNWHLFDDAVALVERARADGLQITADVYTYPAGATGLNASIPPWVQEGGFDASLERMRDPATRERIAGEMLETVGCLGEYVHRRRNAGQHPARRFQNRSSKTLHGQDTRRDSGDSAAPTPGIRPWI